MRSPTELSEALAHFMRQLGYALDRNAIVIYAALAALVFAICRLAIDTFTIEPDEAWILLSTFKAFGRPAPGSELVIFPTVTTGGLHFLLHGLLGQFTRSIPIHRSISLVFLGVLLALVFVLLRRRGAASRNAIVATTLVLATPGLVLQASLAMGEIIVTVLLLTTVIHWEYIGRLSFRGSAMTGILLGLTCATRTNCLVCTPILCVFAGLDAGNWNRNLARAFAILVASMAMYALCLVSYSAMFTVGNLSEFKRVILNATGASVEKPLGNLIASTSLAADFFPPVLIGGLLAGLAACRHQGADAWRLPLLLVALALAGALAWIVKAPIPHVRYAWPFAPLLFVAASLLMHSSGLLVRDWSRLGMHLFVILAVVEQTATAIVLVATGDSLTAVYQANRQAGLASTVAGHTNAQDQRIMSSFIATLPAGAEVLARDKSLGLPLSYLSGRAIGAPNQLPNSRTAPRYYLLSPGDFAVFQPTEDMTKWLNRNGTLSFRSGDYRLYKILGNEPVPPT